MSIYLPSVVVRHLGWKYSGSGDWLDDSGNGHDAVPQNSPTFTTDADGSYFTLNGTNQRFITPNSADFNFTTGDFTVMIRARHLSLPVATEQALISKQPSNAGFRSYTLSLRTSDAIRLRCFDGTNGPIAFGPAGEPDSGDIFTAAGVRDVSGDDDLTVYVADVAGTAAADTSIDISNAADLNYGSAPNGAQWLAGDLFAAVIWNVALTASQIATATTELVTEFEPSTRKVLRSPRYGITRSHTR